MTCPNCGCETNKFIWSGFPGRICESEPCSTATGLASHAIAAFDWLGFPFDGMLMYYEGAYLPALWYWWKTIGDQS